MHWTGNVKFLQNQCNGCKVSLYDGRRGTFSFSRKICKAAPILILNWFNNNFTFTLLALYDGTTAQLQIYSSERNVPFFLLVGENIIERHPDKSIDDKARYL